MLRLCGSRCPLQVLVRRWRTAGFPFPSLTQHLSVEPVTMPIIFSFLIMSIVVYSPLHSACCVEQHHPFQFAHRDDGSHCLRRARHCALLATCFKYGFLNIKLFIHHLDGRQNIPHWHPALRQKSYLERNDEMDIQEKLARTIGVN